MILVKLQELFTRFWTEDAVCLELHAKGLLMPPTVHRGWIPDLDNPRDVPIEPGDGRSYWFELPQGDDVYQWCISGYDSFPSWEALEESYKKEFQFYVGVAARKAQT